ncbi:MAG: hypothetical protein M1379_00180 [Firmicutes bacterium]|nr:hypothetical protein [Bacillota bacterium]
MLTQDGDNALRVGAEQLEQAIRQIRGIISNRVVMDQEGRISEVHVLASRHRNAKQIVRDVEAVCMAQFALPVDHRRVSVAQIEEENAGQASFLARLRLQSVTISSSGGILEVRVTLKSEDQVYEGKVSGPITATNRLRLVAAATIDAVEDYLRGTCNFILDDVVPFEIGQFEGVLVGLTLVTPFSEEGLVGSSMLRPDSGESAVVLAVLNAINRRVSLIAGAEAG